MAAHRAFAVAAVFVGILIATIAPAAAHSELVASSPADGDALAAAPTTITLTFSEDVIAAGSTIVANGPDGRVALGATQVAGPRVSAGWPASQGGGRYTVSYRVVSADGHPITGTIAFSYAGASSSPTASSPTASAASSPVPTSPAAPTVSPASASGGGSGTAVLIVGGVALLALVAVVAVALTRRRT